MLVECVKNVTRLVSIPLKKSVCPEPWLAFSSTPLSYHHINLMALGFESKSERLCGGTEEAERSSP